MAWPYEFVTLTEEETHRRRIALDFYAAIALCSALIPVLLCLLLRLVQRIRAARRGGYQEVPNSPAIKASGLSRSAGWARRGRALMWWLGGDVEFVGAQWGLRDEWVYGGVWTVWLLVLCVVGTGRDYLHFTKRFGIIAASQMPIQYLLALKYLNPFACIFRSSHEQVNRFHRVLGRIIYFLLSLHAVFYNIFFVESGIWLKRFFAPIVFAGVVAFICLHTLNGTAMAQCREWSYRVFFVTHLVGAFAIPPLIYYHAPSARLYVLSALAIFVFDLAARKITTVTAPTSIEPIPGTNLLKISTSLREHTAAKYQARPGSHIYLSIPQPSRAGSLTSLKSGLLFEFLMNPFTVASVNPQTNDLTVIARTRSGPLTARLEQLASSSAHDKVPICIEGPYGAASKALSKLIAARVNRVIIVAGGVGATFALPIYKAILNEAPAARVQLIWAIRNAADATWATSGPDGKSVIEDEHVQLFLTGDMGVSRDPNADGVELSTLQHDRGSNTKRPDLGRIIDDAFRHGVDQKVAVLVCGPSEMARELRRAVTPWVNRGRQVWWHNESFGW